MRQFLKICWSIAYELFDARNWNNFANTLFLGFVPGENLYSQVFYINCTRRALMDNGIIKYRPRILTCLHANCSAESIYHKIKIDSLEFF